MSEFTRLYPNFVRSDSFTIHIDAISMEWYILYNKGHWSKFLNSSIFLSLIVVYILANNADPR